MPKSLKDLEDNIGRVKTQDGDYYVSVDTTGLNESEVAIVEKQLGGGVKVYKDANWLNSKWDDQHHDQITDLTVTNRGQGNKPRFVIGPVDREVAIDMQTFFVNSIHRQRGEQVVPAQETRTMPDPAPSTDVAAEAKKSDVVYQNEAGNICIKFEDGKQAKEFNEKISEALKGKRKLVIFRVEEAELVSTMIVPERQAEPIIAAIKEVLTEMEVPTPQMQPKTAQETGVAAGKGQSRQAER